MSTGTWLNKALSTCFTFGKTLAGVYVFSKYVCFVSRVSGPSMFPTFSGQNDLVLVEAISPMLGRITPGDVVICVRPVDPSEHIIKRVVALAGQDVMVYPDKDSPDLRKVKVPKGHVWIQGDNLLHSLDSRVYGPVPLALVKGRVMFQVWPSFKIIKPEHDAGMMGWQ